MPPSLVSRAQGFRCPAQGERLRGPAGRILWYPHPAPWGGGLFPTQGENATSIRHAGLLSLARGAFVLITCKSGYCALLLIVHMVAPGELAAYRRTLRGTLQRSPHDPGLSLDLPGADECRPERTGSTYLRCRSRETRLSFRQAAARMRQTATHRSTINRLHIPKSRPGHGGDGSG
jgi:hypothetical protein